MARVPANRSYRLGSSVILDGGEVEREIGCAYRGEIGAVNRRASQGSFRVIIALSLRAEGRQVNHCISNYFSDYGRVCRPSNGREERVGVRSMFGELKGVRARRRLCVRDARVCFSRGGDGTMSRARSRRGKARTRVLVLTAIGGRRTRRGHAYGQGVLPEDGHAVVRHDVAASAESGACFCRAWPSGRRRSAQGRQDGGVARVFRDTTSSRFGKDDHRASAGGGEGSASGSHDGSEASGQGAYSLGAGRLYPCESGATALSGDECPQDGRERQGRRANFLRVRFRNANSGRQQDGGDCGGDGRVLRYHGWYVFGEQAIFGAMCRIYFRRLLICYPFRYRYESSVGAVTSAGVVARLGF